ncbi:hypothetical protein BI330_06955 [Mycobacterium sp. CBMA 623]|nr:hypothetical protein [Mycobacteroides sp. CBMA 326]
MLVVVITMRGVAVSVVNIIHVIVVGNGLVAALGAVNMIGVAVRLVLGARHDIDTRPHMRMQQCVAR